MNATHQRKVLLMNSRNGELYNVEGVITSIMFSSYYSFYYLYINLLETQLRTSLAIVGDSIVLFGHVHLVLYSIYSLAYYLNNVSIDTIQ